MNEKPNTPESDESLLPEEKPPLSNADMLALVTNAESERDLAVAESRKLVTENQTLILSGRAKDDTIADLEMKLSALKNRTDAQTAELYKLKGRADEIEVWVKGDHGMQSYKVVTGDPDNKITDTVTAYPLRDPFVYKGTWWTPFRLPKSRLAEIDAYNAMVDKNKASDQKLIYEVAPV